MTLASGTRLGPYEILAPLGAGGMGEVYSARDTRLGRTVAVKILPSEFAADAKLKIRFDHEAKAISALNHPHICSLYDVGPDYLVMEYCEGTTLAARIAGRPLPIEQVIEYGIQIADALDKAHRAGIVHRDLKPGNVMITKSGVKLLDFGLAKQRADATDDEATIAKQLTQEGTIVGTIQYMAPEVLQGKEADARSDIFALGLVLYEMATGKPAFGGSSKASLIAAILEREPPHIEGAPPLDRLIRDCLTKEPDDRIQSAHDVLLQLRGITDFDPSSRKPAGPRLQLIWLFITLAAVTIASFATWWISSHRQSIVRPARFQLQPPPGVAIIVQDSVMVPAVAISPDGEWVAFLAISQDGKSGIYLRSTREVDARFVAGSQGGRDPFFSPDSRSLGFFAKDALQKVSVDGGEPTIICPAKMLRGASWGEDGTILYSDGRQLLRVSADGGEPRVVTSPQLPERHYWPHLLPGSTHALITITRGLSFRSKKVALLTLADGRIRELVPGHYARFAGDRIIYGYADTLFSLPFSLKRLEMIGPPKPVLSPVFSYPSGSTGFDLSKSGSLVYIPQNARVPDTEIVWIDRQGVVSRAVDAQKDFTDAALSPDGKTIAAAVMESRGELDVWTFDLARGGSTQLTSGLQIQDLTWSPDGKSLVVTSAATGMGKLVRVPIDGSAPQQLTSGANNNDEGATISPDGATAVFMRQAPPAVYQLMALPLTSNGQPQPFVGSKTWERFPKFSPDGRWIAYDSKETGQSEVHVRPFPAREPRVTVSIGGGAFPLWSRDGHELFFGKEKEVWSVQVSSNGGAFHAGPPKRIFAPTAAIMDAAPDGRFLALRKPRPGTRFEHRIVYAPNWLAELK